MCVSLAIGITETIAQLVSGWVTDRNLFHKYHYHKAYLILCGLVNLLSPLATSYILLMVYAVFFAIFCGGYMALLLPVLVRTSVQSLGIVGNHLQIVFGLDDFHPQAHQICSSAAPTHHLYTTHTYKHIHTIPCSPLSYFF